MIAIACLCSLFSGLPAAGQLTITNPDEAGAPEKARQVSLATQTLAVPSINLHITPQLPQSRQVRMRVQFLEVDPTTREAIYAGLGSDVLFTSTNLPPTNPKKSDPETVDNFPTTSDSITRSTALVTQAILNTAEVTDILKMIESSNHSIIADAPNLLLLNDNKLDLTDMIKRSYIVNHETRGETIQPVLQHIDEGTRLGIIARVTTSPSEPLENFELGCEVVSRRVTKTRIDFVFGLGVKPLKVQIPHLKVTTARATATLSAGQTLLVDPHVTSTRIFRSETSLPFLGKIPYVGRSFKNVSVATHDQHLIVLLHPESVPTN